MLETVAGTDAQAGEAAGGKFKRVRGVAAAEARPPGYEPVNATELSIVYFDVPVSSIWSTSFLQGASVNSIAWVGYA